MVPFNVEDNFDLIDNVSFIGIAFVLDIPNWKLSSSTVLTKSLNPVGINVPPPAITKTAGYFSLVSAKDS
jgi:hypothetical protein